MGNMGQTLKRKQHKHSSRNPRDRPEDVVMAWLKRKHRMPLTAVETSWLLRMSQTRVSEVERNALEKIRTALEGYLWASHAR